MRPSELVIVRHAEASCDIADVVGGPRGDTGLTLVGRAQAARAAARLVEDERPVAAVYSGPRPRLRQTGLILAAVLGLTLRVQARLGEQRYGEGIDGCAWSEVLDAFGALPAFDPTRPLAEGGECWKSYLSRTRRALSRLVAKHPGERIVVVGTSGTVHASFDMFMELAAGQTGRVGFDCPPTAITAWRELPASPRRPAAGVRWSLVEHFASVRGAEAAA
jgi:probable phosphoglycerate mutase